MNEKIIKKAEGLSLQYDSEKIELHFSPVSSKASNT